MLSNLRKNDIATIFILIVIIVLLFASMLNDKSYYGDTQTHLNYAIDLKESEDFTSLIVPQFLYHISVIFTSALLPFLNMVEASVLLLIVHLSMTAIITYYLLKTTLNSLPYLQSTLIRVILTIGILIIEPITLLFPFPVQIMNYGYIHTSVHVSPTYIFLRPYALLLTLIAFRIYRPERSSWKILALASLVVILGALSKPVHLISLVPALILYTGYHAFYKRQPLDWRLLFVILGTTAVVIIWQYLLVFIQDSQGDNQIVFRPFFPMDYTTDNYWTLLPKFLLSIAFPLIVFIANWKIAIQDQRLIITWLAFIVGCFYGYFLTESARPNEANFKHAPSSTLFILYVVTLIFLLNSSRKYFSFCIIVFCLHIASGILWLIIHTNTPYTSIDFKSFSDYFKYHDEMEMRELRLLIRTEQYDSAGEFIEKYGMSLEIMDVACRLNQSKHHSNVAKLIGPYDCSLPDLEATFTQNEIYRKGIVNYDDNMIFVPEDTITLDLGNSSTKVLYSQDLDAEIFQNWKEDKLPQYLSGINYLLVSENWVNTLSPYEKSFIFKNTSFYRLSQELVTTYGGIYYFYEILPSLSSFPQPMNILPATAADESLVITDPLESSAIQKYLLDGISSERIFSLSNLSNEELERITRNRTQLWYIGLPLSDTPLLEWLLSHGFQYSIPQLAPNLYENNAFISYQFQRIPPLSDPGLVFGEEAIGLVAREMPAQVRPCDTIVIRTWWVTEVTPKADYSLSVRIIDSADEEIITRADGAPGGFQTQFWEPAIPYFDERVLSIPCEAKEGENEVRFVFYYNEGGQIYNLNLVSDSLSLPIEVSD